MKKKVCMIITAGGMSTRQPPNKLIRKIDGGTVIEKTVASFIPFPVKILVVTGYEKEKILTSLKGFSDRIITVYNPDYKEGMSASIRSGVGAAGDCDYFGICTGDKPFIRSKTIKLMLEIIERRSPDILVPTYASVRGHPVFFSSRFKSRLMALTGDVGGRQIVMERQSQTEFVSVHDKGVIFDMDEVRNEGN